MKNYLPAFLYVIVTCIFSTQLLAQDGIVVAGGNAGFGGSAANQLNNPLGVFVDVSGNIYVADDQNYRVQKWAPGASQGVTVAGGNGFGSLPNQLSGAEDVFVDGSGNIYIADVGNNRIQKWAPGASAGITVAGGNGQGSSANQFSSPFGIGIFVDTSGNIFVADGLNNRVQKWAPGATTGVTVAGGNGQGTAANQLSYPSDVFVDPIGNIYIADQFNNRIQKWAPGASSGLSVAGGNGAGSTLSQLNNPTGVHVDLQGNVYIADYNNNRIQKWAPGASAGSTVAGGNGQGVGLNQVSGRKIFVDLTGNVYVADNIYNRILKFRPLINSNSGNTIAGGNGAGSAANQLLFPKGIFVDGSGNLYVADNNNHRIQKWAPGASTGVTVAGGNGPGSAANQFNNASGVYVDAGGNIYVCDANNARIQKWAPGAASGVTVAGGNGFGSAANQFDAISMFIDPAGNIYIPDRLNHRIQKWAPGASSGTTVAGGNGEGSAANQFAFPWDVFVDAAGNMYIADIKNERIQKWAPGASSGVTVAGGNGRGANSNQFSLPSSIFVDGSANIFIADQNNNRVQKWVPGASIGVTVAGGNGQGSAADQLEAPAGLFIDNIGNLYVTDQANHRIQQFGSGPGLNYRYYEGAFTTLPDFNALTPLKTGKSNNIDVGVRTPGHNDNFAFLWEGSIYLPSPGTYNFETFSDDGSKLYFNTPYSAGAIPTVNNDGLHAGRSATGTVTVTAAGSYPIVVTFFESTGDESMQLYWSGPGIPRQLIPDAAFTSASRNDNTPPTTPSNLRVVSKSGNSISLVWEEATDQVGVIAYDIYVGGTKTYSTSQPKFTGGDLSRNASYTFSVKARDLAGNTSGFSNAVTENTSGTVAGLTYKYYEGAFDALPDFNTLTPVKTGSSLNVDIAARTPGRNDNFAFVWEGYINITTPGTYTFETVSDDGSKLYFNSLYDPSAIPIVNNNGVHASLSASGTVNIAIAGAYPISITFFDKQGPEQMQVYWTGPGIARQLIPNSAFTQTPPPPSQNGLTYKYYEGTWNTLPDFNTLTPVKTGTTSNVDISVRTPGHNDNFAFVWQGYINLPVAGNYTFETVSDDGSKLYFNKPYDPLAAATVNNDGAHASASAYGTVNVPSAGLYYPISITYFEKEGGELMQVYWTGPGIERQLIPNSAFTQSPPPPQNGLTYKYYEGSWTALPDFNALTPVKTGTSDNIDIGVRPAGKNDNFAFVWQGYINLPAAGSYTFETVSDDGSKLYFNSLYNPAAAATVNNDAVHAANLATGTVTVTSAGIYPISVTFFESEGLQEMQVYWSGPGIPRQLIPNTAFIQASPANTVTLTGTNPVNILSAEAAASTAIIRVYPNPFDQSFNMDFYNSSAGNDIQVSIFDMKGRLVYLQHANNMVKGIASLKVKPDGRLVPVGVYLAQLKVNGIPSRMVKLVKIK